MASRVFLSAPNPALFTLPPQNEPLALSPPLAGSSATAPPFSIPSWLFAAALDVRVPITIASTYAVTVSLVNRYNKSRGNKPWAISKTRGFFVFVILHNVFLAVYSAWTFYGMYHALARTLQNPNGPLGLVGTVDSLCKLHGTPELDNAVSYNMNSSAWETRSNAVSLTSGGEPDTADLGRLWNEGLGFYGWIFYLSKFYEVLDTVIILAKGKRSSTLQTYHHAGAMMCMWVGIRYMSPPIWMFTLVNAGIHTIMYTYFTIAAFSIRVPKAIKQSITTCQIIQFLVGLPYAAIHSFIYYTVPVQIPVIESAASLAATAADTAGAAVSTGLGGLLNKILGSSSSSSVSSAATSVKSIIPAAAELKTASSFTTEYITIPCIDTPGETLAIWVNVMYLAPLTFLFARFFVKSYLRAAAPSAEKVKKAVSNGVANGSANGKANGHASGHANGYANGKA